MYGDQAYRVVLSWCRSGKWRLNGCLGQCTAPALNAVEGSGFDMVGTAYIFRTFLTTGKL